MTLFKMGTHLKKTEGNLRRFLFKMWTNSDNLTVDCKGKRGA